MSIRVAQKAANVLLLACAALRLAWPSIGADPGYAFLLIGSVRLALMVPDIRRGAEPWQRVLVPGIVLLQLAVVLAGVASRLLVTRVTGALEIALLGGAACFTAWRYRTAQDGRYPEEALADSLSYFVPPAVSRAMAGEIVNLGYAVYAIARGFRVHAPTTGFSYLENSLVPYLTLAVLFESPPEILLLHKLFHVRRMLVTVALIAVHVWAVLWIYGIYIGMRMRPHRVSAEGIVLNRGILGSLRVSPANIESMRILSEGEEPPTDLKFSVKGPPRILIALREPVRARRFLRGPSAPASSVLISVDRPIEFRDAITRILAL